ncbi:MAG: putative 2-dehydropantoate 2-reductase [Cyanobacteriota bacterium]|nr:putative 2-dehydropantoate 2-reductase [Cyanobacteriota bacterium]
MSDRSYAILGTGAIGGFYGARLQQAGLDVRFLLRSDYEVVRDRGLEIESPHGDFTLPKVNAYNTVSAMPECDVAIVALKTTQNHLLPELLPPVLKKNGVVLVLQNGLGIEAEVAAIVGSDRVVGGMCFICSNKVGPGRICHLDYGMVSIGSYAPEDRPCGITMAMGQIAGDFKRADIPVKPESDLLLARWRKLVWNIPFNGLSVVLDATTDELLADDGTRRCVEQLMYETLSIAARYYRLIPREFVREMFALTTKMQAYKTSMKLDYEAGRPMEVEAILGNPYRAAKQVGVSVPRLEMLYEQVKFLDRSR